MGYYGEDLSETATPTLSQQQPRQKANASVTATGISSDKKKGEFNWREWADYMEIGQSLREKASWSQDFGSIEIETDRPILVVPFSDTHMGAWSANVKLFRAMTDEIKALPDAYMLLLGDLIEMAIKLRGVGEVLNNQIPSSQQLQFIESWINEVQHKVLAACWDNHAVEREERGTGYSEMAALLKKRFVYHDGIGHLDVKVGTQTYKLAVSHRFLGNSYLNRTHAPMRYMRFEGQDREIAIQGDIHTPGMSVYHDGPTKRLAITCGTLHTQSLYGRRWFSLYAVPAFPCFELDPYQHRFTPYWSIAEYRAARGEEISADADAETESETGTTPE